MQRTRHPPEIAVSYDKYIGSRPLYFVHDLWS
jgi:hypothetical protein